jgi:hypothetical protein
MAVGRRPPFLAPAPSDHPKQAGCPCRDRFGRAAGRLLTSKPTPTGRSGRVRQRHRRPSRQNTPGGHGLRQIRILTLREVRLDCSRTIKLAPIRKLPLSRLFAIERARGQALRPQNSPAHPSGRGPPSSDRCCVRNDERPSSPIGVPGGLRRRLSALFDRGMHTVGTTGRSPAPILPFATVSTTGESDRRAITHAARPAVPPSLKRPLGRNGPR